MDFIKLKSRISAGIGKYKYVWIVLLAGMILMMIPSQPAKKTETESPALEPEENTTQQQLEEILGYVEGAGSVKVMLTVSQGERTLYQTDSTYNQTGENTDTKTQTILITDSQRNEQGLVHQKNPPVYLGAVVLAQGADDPVVKLAIVEAVSDVTGLGADKISVLKMK